MNIREAPQAEDAKGSPDRFGYSWDRFSELSPEQERQFRLWSVHLKPEDWRDVEFLDGGCGAGRNAYWAMSYGARGCVAIDLDDRSLAAARRNLARFSTARVEKISLYDIPWVNRFDIAFSIGVIHHLSDPQRAVRNLAAAVRPGGSVLIWVYGYENLQVYVNVLNPLRKVFFSWMPLTIVRLLAYAPAALLWLMLRLGITPLEYLRLLKTFSFRHLHHICFDQMLPQTANYWRKDEATLLLERAGLVDIRTAWVNQVSWSVIGTKPEKR